MIKFIYPLIITYNTKQGPKVRYLKSGRN